MFKYLDICILCVSIVLSCAHFVILSSMVINVSFQTPKQFIQSKHDHTKVILLSNLIGSTPLGFIRI